MKKSVLESEIEFLFSFSFLIFFRNFTSSSSLDRFLDFFFFLFLLSSAASTFDDDGFLVDFVATFVTILASLLGDSVWAGFFEDLCFLMGSSFNSCCA